MTNKKIRGITIRFDAEASSLDKALKEVESTSRGLNGELKQVNNLLKFDPKNTQLLAQKQKLLSDAIETSEKKLDALKQAQGEVERMFRSKEIGEREYREFQRTIAETEQSLRSYTVQARRMEEEQARLEKSTKQLNTFIEATGRSLDDFQDILGSRLTNALKDGTANSDDLTVALNKIGRAALGSETDLAKLRDILDKIDDEGIEGVRDSLEELRGASEDADDELSGLGQGLASGILMEAADRISDLGEKVIDLGDKAVETFQNIENASIKVNARLGETGEAAQKNTDLIKRIYESGMGDSMDAVANAILMVRDNLKGLNDSDLEKVISNGLILEDTYGVDMSESLRGINALMQYFGLNAVEAMDYLVAGTQKGLDKTNELGDNLSEYSGKFAEAGYSVQEYFQLLQNGLENGAYNLDKVNDAINEVTTRIADGTIADSMSQINEKTGKLEESSVGWGKNVEEIFRQWQQGGATQKQVIDAIVADIQNTEGQQDKLNKAALAFGTMAEDGSMKFISSLTSVGDTYADVQGKSDEFSKNTTTSAQEMEASMRRLEDSLAPIGEDIQEALIPLLDFIADLAEKFAALPEPVRNFIEVLGAIAAVAAVLAPVVTAISAISGALSSLNVSLLPIIAIIAVIVAAIAGIILVIKNWGAITEWLANKWDDCTEWIGEKWEKLKEKAKIFSDLWKFIKEGFKSLKDDLWGIVKGIANSIVEPIGGAVNGVIKGVNWILDKVGSKKKFDLWAVPKFARGAAGLPEDTIGVVNDQKGPVYKELIVPPKGKPFIAEGRDVVLPMEKGTKILPAKETKKFLDGLPHFANGIGNFFGGAWETIKNFTGSVWDYISKPDKIVQIAIDKFADLSNIAEPWLSVTKGAVNTVFNGVVDFIKRIFDTEASVQYKPNAGVEQWRSLAERALRMTGQYSEANLTRLLHQMQTESGGNPRAINNWDINAKRGTPSKGLMQVIDPTFRTYAMPGYSTDIYDPLSNMLASIRYAVARYGNLARAYRGVGYEEGIGKINLSDLLAMPKLDISWFKDGGILTKPAAFQMSNGGWGGAGEKGAEVIAPTDRLKKYIQEAVLDVIGTKNIEINMNITQTMDGRVLAMQSGKYIQPVLDDMESLKRMLRGER